jgi:hypothetical protein
VPTRVHGIISAMHGPSILVRTMSVPRSLKSGLWQYHSRSDHHSKVACWGILFDLLQESPILREHVSSGAVIFGLNHEMRDFKHNRKKDLDLVLARPRGKSKVGPSFRELLEAYELVLTPGERKILLSLPDVGYGEVGAVQLAMEAKACMTEHLKARPRLYDELNSSHETIHASADEAVAVGFVMVNVAEHFRSPERGGTIVTQHQQPHVTERVIEKVREMPRRTRPGEQGFDALAIVVVHCENDGSPVRLVTEPPAPPTGDIYEYEMMIRRAAQLYASRFRVL